MNKKGFTVVELIVSFTLAMTISVFLFQIVINLKNLYTNSTIKTELINIQSLVSRQMNENFKKGIISVDECGDRCYEFFYVDNTSDKLILSDDSIEFGNYKSKLPKNSYIRNETINISSSTTFSKSFDDSLLIINVPIYNENFKDEVYNIKIVYPYNSNENDLNFGIEFTMDPVGFDYTGGEQVFTVPHSGYYKLEAWGAGAKISSEYGGAYTSGYLYLKKGEIIYVYVGQSSIDCNPYTLCSGESYNGGGSGGYFTASNFSGRITGGGGATDFRITNGEWDNSASLASRIMVAAGAGAGTFGGTLNGYTGFSGAASNNPGGGVGASQISGGAAGGSGATAGIFGIGGNGYVSLPNSVNCNDGFGGGGGYYGGGGGRGGNNDCVADGRGYGGSGSSYISGYEGCIAIKSATDVTPKVSTYSKIEDSYHYSGKIFENPIMIAGNASMPTHDDQGTMTGNSGNGYAKITYVGESLE